MDTTIDTGGSPGKKTKVVHIFKPCLEVGSTQANQDDYFNMGGWGETWEITQEDTCAVLNPWTERWDRK